MVPERGFVSLFSEMFKFELKSLPFILGAKQACAGFRNLDRGRAEGLPAA